MEHSSGSDYCWIYVIDLIQRIGHSVFLWTCFSTIFAPKCCIIFFRRINFLRSEVLAVFFYSVWYIKSELNVCVVIVIIFAAAFIQWILQKLCSFCIHWFGLFSQVFWVFSLQCYAKQWMRVKVYASETYESFKSPILNININIVRSHYWCVENPPSLLF